MSNKNEEKNQSGGDPIIIGSFLAVLGVFGLLEKNAMKIKVFYFNNYEEVYLGLWGLILLLITLIIHLIKKKTKGISERGTLLSPLWSPSPDKILVGQTKDQLELYLSDDKRCTHVQIIGTTGRGKTQSVVIPWALRDLIRRKSVLLIDGKGSRDVPVILNKAIEDNGLDVKVHEFDLDKPESSVKINPLKAGSPQQITDRIFSAFDFDDSFYRAVQYDICGYLMRLIKETKGIVTFRLIYDLLTDDKELANQLKGLEDGHILKKKLVEYMKTPLNDRKQKLAGLTSQLSPFAYGEIAEFVNGGKDEVLLNELMDSDSPTSLLMMSIPTLKYQQLGHQLGKLILQELAFAVGEREKKEKNEFCSVFLDEFSEFVYEGFISVLNKARSAKVALHLSHQSVSDLSKVSPDFALSINTNTNVKCIMGLNDPETADFYARHFGTMTTEKVTEQVEEKGFFKKHEQTGRGSLREVESYKVHPNILKELCNGRGVLHVPTERGNVTEVIQFYPINMNKENLING